MKTSTTSLANLKIKPEHFEQMAIACQATIAGKPDAKQSYADQGLSDKRFRWDVLNASTIDGKRGTLWICDNLYPYLNDEHIDSALRQIVK